MDEAIATKSEAGVILNATRGLLGAAVGGAAAYFVTGWIVRQGFYAMALPGFGLGLGAGLLVTKRCMGVAIVCGLLALALGLFTEWMNFPWPRPHESFGYFLRHLGDLRPLTQILIGLGAVAGFWFALGVGRRLPTRTV